MNPLKKRRPITLTDSFSSVEVNGIKLQLDITGNITISSPNGATVTLENAEQLYDYSPPGRNLRTMKFEPSAQHASQETNDQSIPQLDMQPAPHRPKTIPIAQLSRKNSYAAGEELPDGWIVMGISPDTGKVFSAEPVAKTSVIQRTWYEGQNHAKNLRHAGHRNARQPSKDELTAIYNEVVTKQRNHLAKFITNGTDLDNRYWSSSENEHFPNGSHFQDLRTGNKSWAYKVTRYAYVRCVRDEPRITLK